MFQSAQSTSGFASGVALLTACENGKFDEVRRMLADPCADIPADDYDFALKLACKNGHPSVVQLLLASNYVDPSNYAEEAIKDACNNGNAAIVRKATFALWCWSKCNFLLLRVQKVLLQEQSTVTLLHSGVTHIAL